MVLGSTYVLDSALFMSAPLWKRPLLRTTLSGLAVILMMGASSYLALAYPGIFSAIILVLSLYRALNYARIALGRMNFHALIAKGRRSILWLNGLQLGMLVLWLLWGAYGGAMQPNLIWYAWALGACIAGAVSLVSSMHSLNRSKMSSDRGVVRLATNELPTVTVAVSAHGDREALVACLDSVIGSAYPKLEILALDDGKQQKHTPEVIKMLAQNGVRFLEAPRVRDGWLARNQAYDQLAREASGDFIIFMGADVRLAPEAIRGLIEQAHVRGKQMLSVAPLGPKRSHKTSLALAMRYIWEFAPPRRRFHRPPVLSSLWLIERSALKKLGGLAAVKRSITPEAYFAGALIAQDRYGFVRATPALGVQIDQPTADHLRALLRVRYPALHRHIEFVSLLTAAYSFVILVPLVLITVWLLGIAPLGAGVLGCLAYLCFMLSAGLIFWRCRLGPWLAGLAIYPAAALLDLAVMHASLWQYELGDINWRGRSAVQPVMQVEKRLPRF